MKVKKCPVCKSKNITTYMGLLFGKYYCNKCNYLGALVLEEETKVKRKIKKEIL